MSRLSTNRPESGAPPKVALLIETSNAYARGLLAGIEDYILSDGPWNVYLAEQNRGDRPPSWLHDWDGDGILARVENEHIADSLRSMRAPLVDLSAFRLLPEAPMVTTDNEAIARLAFQHFTERGFENFAFCGESRFVWSQNRGEYFRAFSERAGARCHEFAPSQSMSNSDAETDQIGDWLLALPKPVGLLACYDARGQQVLNACRRAGLAVPEQVAVLGVDNDELLCALSPPPLSSVMPNPRRAGREAARLLAQMMKGQRVPAEGHLIAPIGVATRQSTDVLAVADPQVARVLHFIREHACEGISVSDVLKHCPMARRALESRLQLLLGRTPREEIARVQLNRVKELLAGTELPLSEIAERVGFRHTEYLSVVFKRETGITPSEFRKKDGPRA